jgi:hypothetical protein
MARILETWFPTLFSQVRADADGTRPTRQVALQLRIGGLKIVDAQWSDAGWIACLYTRSDDDWMILLPDGTTQGNWGVKTWVPICGWAEDPEFSQLVKTTESLRCRSGE